MRRLLLSTVMALAVAPAFAADLPSRAAPAAPAPAMARASAYNWTGFYVGVNAGYNWGSSDLTVTNPAAAAFINRSRFSPSPDGFSGGVQAGYNYQINQFVLGVEGDANFSTGKDREPHNFANGTVNVTSKIGMLSSIRARVGFAADRFLVYGTGGVAFANAKTDATLTVTSGEFAGQSASGNSSANRTGWALGAGVEYAFTQNITGKVEYMYYDLGEKKLGADGGAKVDLNANIVRIGVNYKF